MPEDPLTPGETLKSELEERRLYANTVALRLAKAASMVWWSAIICAGLASGLGFVAAIPEVKQNLMIEPWMISLIALFGSGFEIVRRKSNWRIKSNLFFQHRDDIDRILSRINYELPKPLSPENTAALAREYRERKISWGEQMKKLIQLTEDDPPTTK